MQIEWPEKIEMDFYGESTQPYNQTCVNVGWNSAIDACKEAFDKAQSNGLVALDFEAVERCIQQNDRENEGTSSFSNYAAAICAKFGQPSPTPGKWKEIGIETVGKWFYDDWCNAAKIQIPQVKFDNWDNLPEDDKMRACFTDKAKSFCQTFAIKDEFCGIPMDSVEVEAKLLQYGYVKATKTDANV